MSDSFSPVIPNLRDDHALVVACTGHFFDVDFVADFALPIEWGTAASCRFTSDLSLMDEADALWFHGPNVRKLPKKRQGQKWIVMSMESDQNYPFMQNRQIMDMFDITMTYRLDSDVPCIYPNRAHYGGFKLGPHCLAEKQVEKAPAVYIASHPVPRRDEYVQELMRSISIDSLGKCLNNRSFEDFDTRANSWRHNGFHAVAQVLKRYKFYLAFENSISEDYVTERVLMALAFGVVPVYQGAPNIGEFLPSAKCLINADDFESPAALADYLNYLDGDDLAYDEYLAWRSKPFSPQFTRLLDVGSIDSRYRMLLKLLHGCDASCDCGGRMRF